MDQEPLVTERTIEDPNFDPFRVKVIGIDDPLAQAALDSYRRFPARVPTRVRAQDFGSLGTQGVYLDPLPVPAVQK